MGGGERGGGEGRGGEMRMKEGRVDQVLQVMGGEGRFETRLRRGWY